MGKISSALLAKLEGLREGDMVELVVELAGAPSAETSAAATRAERISRARQAFSESARPIEEAISGAGGEVLDRLWLANAIRARVPARAVDALSKADRVSLLDSTRPLEAEIS